MSRGKAPSTLELSALPPALLLDPAALRALVGGKAAATANLLSHGVVVPRSVAVGWPGLLEQLTRAAGGDDAQAATFCRALLSADGAAARARIAAEPTSPALLAELTAACRGHTLSIVRSSGVHEDSAAAEAGAASASLAGHYQSIVCRPIASDLDAAVRACLAQGVAVFVDHVLDDEARAQAVYGDDAAVLALWRRACRSLALLVQPVVDAVASGVCFTRSPLHEDAALVVAGPGTCHPVVDGTLASDSFAVFVDGRIERAVRHKFEMTVVRGDVDDLLPGQELDTPLGRTVFHTVYGRGLAQVRTPEPGASDAALDDERVRQVVAAAQACAAVLGQPADVEWSFDPRGTLVVLQARPITTDTAGLLTAAGDDDAALDDADVLATGLIASPGVGRGPVRVLLSPDDIDLVEEGDVLCVTATDPDYMPALYKAAAVVSEDGSPLSHTAIVARELRLPCLVGVERATRGRLPAGAVVTVDARRGRIVRADDGADAAAEPDDTDDADDVLDRLDGPLSLAPGSTVTVAASALFDALMHVDPSAELSPAAAQAWLARFARRHGVTVSVRWDLVDDALAPLDRDPVLLALRLALAPPTDDDAGGG